MHGRGSSRAERVRSDVFWGEAKSCCSHSQTLGPDYVDDVGCADGAETMIGEKFFDGGDEVVSPVAQAEEDANARLD